MLFEEDRITPATGRVRWPNKPRDEAALRPQDVSLLALMKKYGVEVFRVNDGWAAVKGEVSTVVSFSAPLDAWEKIMQELCSGGHV
jgi:hypothetical protein